ncbi:MAG: mycofactocin biosynthesis chaperone MftB [Rhodospirillales bacterium]
MNLDDYYRLADGIAVRPERFGGLAYSYHDRRLYFIHSHGLAAFAGGLDGTRSLGEAIGEFRGKHDLGEDAADAILRSLAMLERMGLVVAAAA